MVRLVYSTPAPHDKIISKTSLFYRCRDLQLPVGIREPQLGTFFELRRISDDTVQSLWCACYWWIVAMDTCTDTQVLWHRHHLSTWGHVLLHKSELHDCFIDGLIKPDQVKKEMWVCPESWFNEDCLVNKTHLHRCYCTCHAWLLSSQSHILSRQREPPLHQNLLHKTCVKRNTQDMVRKPVGSMDW